MSTAVVTGIGIAAPNGLGPTSYWQSLMHGRPVIAPVTRFDVSQYRTKLGGEVPDFEPGRHLQSKMLPQTDHMTRMAMVAADWALKQAMIRPGDVPDSEMGVVTAASGGGYEFGQRELAKLYREGPDHVSAYQSFAWFYAVNTGQISIRHGLRGSGSVLISDQAGGLDAVGHARRQLRRGECRAVLTGGVDSTLCPWAWVAHQATNDLSTSSDPDRAYLPFHEDADGYVLGEGGTVFVLEELESAQARPGTRVYGEIAGYKATFDSKRPGATPGLQRALEGALEDAQLDPSDIDVVFADATAVPAQDAEEAAVLREVFGPYGVPVTAPKTMIGRLIAGGAALDAVTAVLSVYWGMIPPTVNVGQAREEHELDLVTTPRHQQVKNALVLARGRGGFNSAVVVKEAA